MALINNATQGNALNLSQRAVPTTAKTTPQTSEPRKNKPEINP